jgi:uncharacterized protein (TIGR04141 family)
MFRIEETFTDPDKIIVGRQQLDHIPVGTGDDRLGDLYVRRTGRELPKWAEYFASRADFSPILLATASLAAVFLVSRAGRLYAFTFGYGRVLLNEDAIERRFGLRATLNGVHPSQLRSIDHKRLDAISRHTREQLSKAGALDQFGLDTDRDVLGAVTGTPADEKYGKRMSGADQLTIVADIPIDRLSAQIDLYANLASKTDYTTNFPWVDNIREIKDNALSSALDAVLVASIKSGVSNCWIAPPDLIDWDSPLSFCYHNTKSAKHYTDLDIEEYFAELGSADDMTQVRLAGDRIFYSTDGESAKRSWSVSRCLIADCAYNGRRYVLNDGLWYEIDANFVKVVDDFVQSIDATKIDLPDYQDKDEGAYNTRAAKRDKANLICLDRRLISYPPRGKIEVCDLYSKSRQFVHVKRCAGSGTLSHLFSQGVVSAQLMVSDPGFRAKFQALLPSSHRWGDPSAQVVADQFEVCYAIVARKKRALELPFFSRVSLRAAAKNIRQLGMKVSLLTIPS